MEADAALNRLQHEELATSAAAVASSAAQVKLLALQRQRDEKQRVADAALCVLLDGGLAALVLPDLHARVAALSRVCHALRSAAELETERSMHDLVCCSICRRGAECGSIACGVLSMPCASLACCT